MNNDLSYLETLTLAEDLLLILRAFDEGKLDGYKDITKQLIGDTTTEYFLAGERVCYVTNKASNIWSNVSLTSGRIRYNQLYSHYPIKNNGEITKCVPGDKIFEVSEEQFFYNTLTLDTSLPTSALIFGVLSGHKFEHNAVGLYFDLEYVDILVLYAKEVMHNAM